MKCRVRKWDDVHPIERVGVPEKVWRQLENKVVEASLCSRRLHGENVFFYEIKEDGGRNAWPCEAFEDVYPEEDR